MNVISSWSGGKDSCYALMKAIMQGFQPVALLNMMNENGEVSRSHGIPDRIMQLQATAMGLPLHGIPTTWSDYEDNFINSIKELKAAFKAEAVVFGDIDIERNKAWEQKVSERAGLRALLPIWEQPRRSLLVEMLENNIKAIITSCQPALGRDFLGKVLDGELIELLEREGVDACGELGEYHTLVFECPMFNRPLALPSFSKKQYQDYCFLSWNI